MKYLLPILLFLSSIAFTAAPNLSLKSESISALYQKLSNTSRSEVLKSLQDTTIIDPSSGTTVRDLYAGVLMEQGFNPFHDTKVKEICSFSEGGLVTRIHIPDLTEEQFSLFTHQLKDQPHIKTLGDLKVIVEPGSHESASIGSYSVRVFKGEEFSTGKISQRDGELVDVWLLESKEEANLFVWLRSAGSGGYGQLEIFDVSAGGGLKKWDAVEFAGGNGYMGYDSFRIDDGKVVREHPRYLEGDSNAKPTGGTMAYELDLMARKWMVVK